MPADFRHQIAHRTFPGRNGCARGDLLRVDDEQRLHLRERQYRDPRSGLRRHADRAGTSRRRDAGLCVVQFVRLRRHQCVDRAQATGSLEHFEKTSNGRGSGMPALMQGKRGLIMGVANDHSIAWGIARTLAAHGATLALTYQGDALGRRVRPLAESLGSELVLPCDVDNIASVDAVFATLAEKWGALDFLVHAIAFSDKNEPQGRYADTTRENFVRTMMI